MNAAEDCLPTEVRQLAAEEQAAARELEVARGWLRQRHELAMVSPDYIPCAHLEAAAKDGERRVQQLKQRQADILRRCCLHCKTPCAASMA